MIDFNFKMKVVEPALKEINQKLNMRVSYTENKVGRSVTSLTFVVDDLESRSYDFSRNKPSGKNKDNFIKLKFNNFEAREYDYDDLERKLLGWDK